MYVILLGPPGAGKGTQAAGIVHATGLVHVATGDMFRENVRLGTALGLLAKQYMDRGELVPDAVTIGMLRERLDRPDAADGSLLDGFPRTTGQARALDDALTARGQQVDRVLLIDVPPDEARSRLGGRWSCPQDGSVYHEVTNPPKTPGRCDRGDAGLIQRDDDTPAAIDRRLTVYDAQTAPLIRYYEQARKLVRVDGARLPALVTTDLLAVLGAGVN
jgi:adenylate kinase